MTSLQSIMDALAAAKADSDAMPALRNELADVKLELELAYDDLANRSKALSDRDEQIESLSASLRAAEVARDEAMFRAAELQDRCAMAAHSLGSIRDTAQDYFDALTSAAQAGSIATKAPEVKHEQERPTEVSSLETTSSGGAVEGPSANNPTTSTITTGSTQSCGDTSIKEDDSQGPFASSLSIENSQSENAHSVTASTLEDASMSSKPYFGKATWNKPPSVTWGEFIDGGGDEPYWGYDRNAK